jgi:hypothetical protein
MSRLIVLLVVVVGLAALLAPTARPDRGDNHLTGTNPKTVHGEPIEFENICDDDSWPTWSGIARARATGPQDPPTPPDPAP